MTDNNGRVLTMRIVVNDSKKAEWIWESLKGRLTETGVKVCAVADGDLFKERDDLLNEIDKKLLGVK